MKWVGHRQGRRAGRRELCTSPYLWRLWEATTKQVKRVASAQARQTGVEQSEVTKHLYQRMGVLLALVNAAMLLNRSPAVSLNPAMN